MANPASGRAGPLTLTYSELERPPRYMIRTAPRQARERHKERIVSERQFDTWKLIGEEVAEFAHCPVACKTTYWVVEVRKKLIEEGQLWLFEPDRYFFHITNDRTTPASEIVFLANGRCTRRTRLPNSRAGVKGRWRCRWGDLVSNWAYMVMASLAWSLEGVECPGVARGGRWRRSIDREAVAAADGVQHRSVGR